MFVEARVLGGQERLLQALGHVLHLDRIAPGLAEHGHQLAVAGMHVHRLLQLHLAQGLHVGQLRGNHVIEGARGDGADQGKGNAQCQQPAQPATETGHQAGSRLRISWPQSIEYAGERLGPSLGEMGVGDGSDGVTDFSACARSGCQSPEIHY